MLRRPSTELLEYIPAMTARKIYLEGEEMKSALEDMLRRAKAGTLPCTGIRAFNADGTFRDIALGGTAEERKEMLAKLADRKGMN